VSAILRTTVSGPVADGGYNRDTWRFEMATEQMDELKILRKRLDERLEGRGTLAVLEEKAGLSRGHLSKLLTGKRPMRGQQLIDLAGALDVIAPRTDGGGPSTLESLTEGCEALQSMLQVGDVGEAERRESECAKLLADAEGRATAADDRARALAAEVTTLQDQVGTLLDQVAKLRSEVQTARTEAQDARKAHDAEKTKVRAVEGERDNARRRAAVAEAAMRLPRTGTPMSNHLAAIGIDNWRDYALHLEWMNEQLGAQLGDAQRKSTTRGMLATLFGAVAAGAVLASGEIPEVPGGRKRGK
jgi:transcriptional regulator with XRE-family HTH domain